MSVIRRGAVNFTRLGEQIRARRQALGLTQHGLASRAHVGQAWLARVEQGQKAGMHIENFVRLGQALRCSLDYMVGYLTLPEAWEQVIPVLEPPKGLPPLTRLRHLKKHLSKDLVARIVGVPPATLEAMEAGAMSLRPLKPEQRYAWAALLQISLDELEELAGFTDPAR